MANELATEKTMKTAEIGASKVPSVQAEGQVMPIDEIANLLGYDREYLRKKCAELGFTKNGVKTSLNEEQVTKLKSVLVPRTSDMKVRGQNAVTHLEMLQNIQRDMQWLISYNAELQAENERLSAKNESLEFALEYDKAKDCVSWGEWKKQNKIKASFERIVKELNLEEGEDYFRQVLANGSRFPTIRVKESCLQSIFENYSEK